MNSYSFKANVKSCVVVVATLFSLGAVADKVRVDDESGKVRTTRCTKDYNRWGHSGSCECSHENYQYNQKVGRCLVTGSRAEVKPSANSMLEGCEGGEFSYDKKRLSCPDGSVYEKVTDTLDDISRAVAADAKDYIQDSSNEETEEQAPVYHGSSRAR